MNRSMEACELEFNSFERGNKDIIAEYEKNKGWR